jgi:hypothetical protein
MGQGSIMNPTAQSGLKKAPNGKTYGGYVQLKSRFVYKADGMAANVAQAAKAPL